MSTTDLNARAYCLLGNPETPHAASLGLLVCDGHRQKLYEALRAIVDTTARIAVRPVVSGQATGTRSGSLASQRSVIDMESLALAGPLAPGQVTTSDGWDDNHPLATVGLWARAIREDNNLAEPAGPIALTTEVNLVVKYLDWCCAQPWIDDMTREINASLARVQRADPTRIRPGDEGRCPQIGIDADTQCGGQLRRERGAVPWLTYTNRCERTPIDVHAGIVRCQKCGAAWPTENDEARLRVMRADAAKEMLRPVDENGTPMRTARELASARGKSLASTRQKLHRMGVRPIGGHWYSADVFTADLAHNGERVVS